MQIKQLLKGYNMDNFINKYTTSDGLVKKFSFKERTTPSPSTVNVEEKLLKSFIIDLLMTDAPYKEQLINCLKNCNSEEEKAMICKMYLKSIKIPF
jgi:hypothetical protein